jgi:predicted transcriptional regulator
MRLVVKKVYERTDVELLQRYFRKVYGRWEKVRSIAKTQKCTRPEVVDVYMIWDALRRGASIREEVYVHDPRVFNALTRRRVELIEFLNRNRPISLKNAAEKMGRDYKNVYDDFRSLSEFQIVTPLKAGNRVTMVGRVVNISADLE